MKKMSVVLVQELLKKSEPLSLVQVLVEARRPVGFQIRRLGQMAKRLAELEEKLEQMEIIS